MRHCELTLSTPEENLACDEVLLDLCEEGGTDELLRFWEPNRYFVVVGYANRVATEVNQEFCLENTIPVLRRCSGGGTVLQGPGCLNYSLILHQERRPDLRSIPSTNAFILERHERAFSELLRAPVVRKGHTDLAIGGLKFSGNAQRRRKNCVLFHGSFLLNMDIELIQKALPLPSKRPDYRLERSHTDFLVNLKVPPTLIHEALIRAWDAPEAFSLFPLDRINLLARDRYSTDSWNLKF